MSHTALKEDRFALTKDTKTAQNYFEQKLSYIISPYELNSRLNESDIQVIDVRSVTAYKEMHIKGAISIPLDDLRSSLDRLSKEQINVVYCTDLYCHASARAAVILAERGYPVMELEGGIKTWNQKALPVEKGL
jgi:rhodanese-related sulfurtransferase